MKYKTRGITDTGIIRPNNEDAYLIDDNVGLFLVSDGMGGHQAGEVASQLAIEVIQKYFAKSDVKNEGVGDEALVENDKGATRERLSPEALKLVESIHLANKIIHQVGEKDEKYRGMGCTIAALLLVDPDRAIIANVGDSRIYLFRDSKLEQLNEDHTLLNEYLKSDPEFADGREEKYMMSHLDHILVRALGIDHDLEVDVREVQVRDGDRFLLCSDGLTDMLSDSEIREVFLSEKKLDKLCDKLVALANEKGGVDNITTVVVEIENP